MAVQSKHPIIQSSHHLILASTSPRRLELLRQAGIEPAEIIPAAIDESEHKGELPREAALRLAEEKAKAVYARLSPPLTPPQAGGNTSFILGADTVVACGRRSLPKAETPEQARHCLEMLSGRRHHVYGGIALIHPDGKMFTRLCDTVVQFKKLSAAEIGDYLQSGEWRGKAGGYAIQGRAAGLVKFIRGSHSNVIGLSLYDTMQMLRGSGFFS